MSWQQFVHDYRIPYQTGTRGKDSTGNIEVHCPLCGPSDKGRHLGLNLKNSRWSCWRDKRKHSGVNPTRIIMALLQCTRAEALVLSEKYFNWRFDVAVAPSDRPKEADIFKPPAEFMQFSSQHPKETKFQQRQFVAYIKDRGLRPEYVCERFDLRWVTSGDYAWRLVIPIKQEREWRTFVARAIGKTISMRYKAYDGNNNRPDDFLFDGDNLTRGRALIVCEGVFDAIAVNHAFIPSVASTALCGKNLSLRQINLLAKLAPNFERVILALDEGTESDSFQILADASWYIPNLSLMFLKEKDFGSMSPGIIQTLIEQELNKGEINEPRYM